MNLQDAREIECRVLDGTFGKKFAEERFFRFLACDVCVWLVVEVLRRTSSIQKVRRGVKRPNLQTYLQREQTI